MFDREAYLKAARDVGADPYSGVAFTLTITKHEDGSLSVQAPVADRRYCRLLLDQAWAAINRTTPTLVTPARDVDQTPYMPIIRP
jgi:hypothetical protein